MLRCIGCEGDGAPGWPGGRGSKLTMASILTAEPAICDRCARGVVVLVLERGCLAPGEHIAVLHQHQREEWLQVAQRYDAKAAEARQKGGG